MDDNKDDVLAEEKVELWKTLIGSVPGGDEVDVRESRDERLGKL